jgi:hypothetical protein
MHEDEIAVTLSSSAGTRFLRPDKTGLQLAIPDDLMAAKRRKSRKKETDGAIISS